MMLKASLPSQNTFVGHTEVNGNSCGYIVFEENTEVGDESWSPTKSSEIENQDTVLVQRAYEGLILAQPQETESKHPQETVQRNIMEETAENKDELPYMVKDGHIIETSNINRPLDEVTTGSLKDSVDLDPCPDKTETVDHNLERKHVTNIRSPPTLHQTRKSYITRSVSLTEKELKEAQSISYNNDSQLSPAQSGCSKGALLFHRRRQRIKALEKYIPVGNSETQKIQEPQENKVQHGLKFLETEATEPCTGSGCSTTINMEETSSDIVYSGEIENTWGDDLKGVEFPSIEKRAPSPSASESDNQEPLSAYLKENLVVTNTNGLHNQINHETEPIVKKEQNGMETRQYCEVHLTLSKPKSVANRTAKPFGNQLSAKKNLCSSEKSAVIDLPPPPTYAETLSSPPPVTRIRSPPAYSALYPTEAQHITPVVQVASHGEARLTPQPKSGILESIGSRRGTKKSMFTFIEKPKMAPNPDLLSMVQTADERRKQKDQGEVPTEEEPFALGAEASNFQNKTTKAGDNVNKDTVPDWATCLKSPGSRGKPPPAPVQTLTEDKGKGAELFARRQTRMEKFVVESSHNNSIRSPSPTMSLPPSWKFSPNEQASSLSFVHQVKINQRSPKPPVVTSVANPALESDKSRKELEISKRQPYQLQSSLFILSPNKDPVSSLPRAAPPPKPMVLESQRFTRQSSCPPSPIVPSPATNSPTYFRSVQSPSTAMSPTVSDSPIGYGRRTPTNHISPMSPVPFSNTGVVSPRTKAVIQAPRPLFSARNAGLESQKSRDSTSPHKPLQHQTSIDGWESPSSYLPGYREGTGIQSPPPPRPMSPAWSDRSPSPFRVESDLKAGKQMKALIARNIINAAKRKSSSPWGQTSPQSPIYNSGTWSPRMGNGSPLPETPRGRRSPTGSDISLESEDSGAKSPGFRSYPLSPRGWYGSMRLKRDSLPANPSYT